MNISVLGILREYKLMASIRRSYLLMVGMAMQNDMALNLKKD
jgi:hypothetical protein